MKQKTFFALIISFVTSLHGVASAEINLTLEQAVKMGIEKNLDISVERFNPEIARSDLRKNETIFDIHLTGETSIQNSRSAIPSTGGASESFGFTLSPGIKRLIPTGGTLGAVFNNAYSDLSPSTTGSYWGSDVMLTLNQPLLKNFGREATELSINSSKFSLNAASEKLKTKILDLTLQISNEYYNLYLLSEDKKSKIVSIDLARKILNETKAKVSAGVLPAMEILNAEYGVSKRESELIESERLVKDQEESLKQLLRIESAQSVIPITPPRIADFKPVSSDTVLSLIENRTDLKELDESIRSLELQKRVYEMQVKPDLNLSASAAFTGAGKGYASDIERTLSMEYPRWSVGLSLDYPLGTKSAREDAVKAGLKLEQGREQRKNLLLTVKNKISNLERNILSAYKQIEVSLRGEKYAEERLKAFSKKHEVGLATAKDLLDVETDLAAAKSSRIKSESAYAALLNQYWRAVGKLQDVIGFAL